MRLVVLGPPGVGKGTQTKLLANLYQVPHISTGDILRANVSRKTELGITAQSYMDHGQLVPDNLVIAMVDSRLLESDCQSGFLMDGYPRTLPQAHALHQFLKVHKLNLQAVINLTLETAEIVRRLAGRRVCTSCGAIFHIEFAPSTAGALCDRCGAGLVQRQDDYPSSIRQRVEIYSTNVQGLIDFYHEHRKLLTISGAGTVDEIHQRIITALNEIGQR